MLYGMEDLFSQFQSLFLVVFPLHSWSTPGLLTEGQSENQKSP